MLMISRLLSFFFFSFFRCRLLCLPWGVGLKVLNRYTLLDLRSRGHKGLPIRPKVMTDAEALVRTRAEEVIKADSTKDRDMAPAGVIRGARTTLDAIRTSTHAISSVTTYAGFAQLAGLGCTQLHDEEFGLGASLEMVYANRISDKPDSPKAVKVWIVLQDGDQDDVREEYVACHSSGESGIDV